MQTYEDSLCSSCGQELKYAMDPDLSDEWTSMEPHRCGACTALAEAAKANEDGRHPGALRYVLGLREGWEQRKAAKSAARAERATSSQ